MQLGLPAGRGCVLAVAAQHAIAAFLLELPLAGECDVAGDAPELHEVLADVRWQLPVLGSRRKTALKPKQERSVGHSRCFVAFRGRKKANKKTETGFDLKKTIKGN